MAPHLLLVLHILFFLTGLSDTQSVSTVSHVSVKQGGSITIPCLYTQRYRNNVKYWCKGYYWLGGSTVVRTDHPKTSGKTPISDDINQHIFTVTMTSLSPSDSDYYWCIVVRKNKADDGVRLQLSVTPDTPGLYVDSQEVTGVVGQNVTVRCYYSEAGARGRWCRMGRGGKCLVNSGFLDRTSVTLHQQTNIVTNGNVLTVTMSALRMVDTGWYRCENGDYQMPVHITVNQQTTKQNTTTFTQDISAGKSGESAVSSQPSVNNIQTLERTFFYLLKVGNALLFLLCNIIGVVKFRKNRHQDDTKDV
ncbi:polymeric immunoglobulin receptor isoform X1 [Salmo salar]|uniref:polymeric immunoglobulin receptor isoform X1 n=1 Tax=Salmo salar TaxID=8030 RepID=UPI0006B7F058|nr:polymeric immunoglobulin receptor isoform X1 [Salmo salar]|eukprot:XP_014010096.1 PREDICTED: polymeric immunoglobulin receptor-like isoform X1 [Salmo salar]